MSVSFACNFLGFIYKAETYSTGTIFLLCFPVDFGVICLVLIASCPPFLELLLLLAFLLPVELLPLLGPVIGVLLIVDWLVVLWDVAVFDFLADKTEGCVNSSSSSDPSNASSSSSSSSSACHEKIHFILFYINFLSIQLIKIF